MAHLRQLMLLLPVLLLLVTTPATSSPLRRRKERKTSLFFIKELFGGSDETDKAVPEDADAGFMFMAEQEYFDYDRLLDGSFSMCMSMPSPRPPSGPPKPPSSPSPRPPTPRPPSGGTPTSPTPRPPTVSSPPTNEACLEGTTKAAYLEEELKDVPGFSTDPATDEGKAFDWFVNIDTLDVCTHPTLEQRYALAAFWFSTGGEGWTSDMLWTTSAPECDWQFITCNGSGDVTAMEISEYIV